MDPENAKTLRQQLAQARAQTAQRHEEHLRQQILVALSEPPSVKADVYLFGSWATGEFDGASDTDLLAIVERPEQVKEGEGRLMAVGEDVIVLTESQWRQRLATNPGFYKRLNKERKLLVSRSEVTADE